MLNLARYTIIKKQLRPLSLAVWLKDESALAGLATGKVEVSLRNLEHMPVRNLSGYFNFLALPNGKYTVSIASDYYLTKEFEVTLPSLSSPPGGPLPSPDPEVALFDLNGAVLAEVALIPNVTYPFPAGATLVRLEVTDNAGVAVPGAMLRVRDPAGGNQVESLTNANGQGVLFCNRVTVDEILEINGKQFGGGRQWRVRASHPDFGNSSEVDMTVPDGETIFQKIRF